MARVLLFGAFADAAGWRKQRIAGATIGEIRRAIADRQPDLGERLAATGTLVIIDHEIMRGDLASDDRALPDDAELAFGPPVSGG